MNFRNIAMLSKNFRCVIATLLVFMVTDIGSLQPASATGSVQTYTFPATIDVGLPTGGTWGTVGAPNPNGAEISMTWYNNSYGSQSDLSLLYFDNYQRSIGNATANQIVSATLNITWSKVSQNCPETYIQIGQPTVAWGNSSTSTDLIRAIGSNTTPRSAQLIPSITAGTRTSFDVAPFLTRYLAGDTNYGFSFSKNGTYCNGGDGVSYYSSEAGNSAVRPYIEITVDTSRSRYARPTATPQNLTLIPKVNGVTAQWGSVPENVQFAVVEFTCSASGLSTQRVALPATSVERSGLITGERCSARIASENDGGISPFSMSTQDVIVSGSAPSLSPSVSLKNLPFGVLATVGNPDPSASEVSITLSCNISGRYVKRIPVSQKETEFSLLKVGEVCSAYATSLNSWGSSANGIYSNSTLVTGALPVIGTIEFFNNNPNQLQVDWSYLEGSPTTVTVTMECNKTGLLTRTAKATDSEVVFTGLASGETCEMTAFATSTSGNSNPTQKKSLTVKGSGPTDPIFRRAISPSPGVISIAWQPSQPNVKTSVVLDCSSEQTVLTRDFTAETSETSFLGLIYGESCEVMLISENEWGSSDQVYFDTAIEVMGNAPEAPKALTGTLTNGILIGSWSSPIGIKKFIVKIVCSKSGSKTLQTSQANFQWKVSSEEKCSYSVAAANSWGTSQFIKSVQVSPSTKVIASPGSRSTIWDVTCKKGVLTKHVQSASAVCPTGWKKIAAVVKN